MKTHARPQAKPLPSAPSRSWLWGLLLAGLVLAAYFPALREGFIWDDDQYVTANRTLHDLSGLKEYWLMPGASPQYYPLVFTSFWLEYHLWKLAPLGYHLDNIILHALAAWLLYQILLRLRVPGAWLAAAIFALHPVQVESVVWVTERKNVLSAVFYFAAALAYLRFSPMEADATSGRKRAQLGLWTKTEKISRLVPSPRVSGERARERGFPKSSSSPQPSPPQACEGEGEIQSAQKMSCARRMRWPWYFLAFALFVAALSSKTVTCSLPAALLLVCWWKRGQVRWADAGPLLPFFTVGAGLGLATAWFEKHHVGAEGAAWALTFAQRILIAGRALWFYALKLVWPAHLTFIYPRWHVDANQWWQWLFPTAAIAVVAALWFMRRRWGRGPLVAVLLFAGTLGPALGFINIYPMRFSFVADHFQYLAAIGLIILLAAWASRWPRWTMPFLLAVLAVLTSRQTGLYRDSETLWRTTLERNPDSIIARNKLGVVLLEKGHVDEAAGHFQRILEVDPDSVEARCNMGVVLAQNGQLDEAAAQFQRALAIETNYDVAYNGLGSVLLRQHRTEEAMAQFRKAIALNPGYLNARLNLGLALASSGKMDDAVAQFQSCLILDPDNSSAHGNLGDILLKVGRVEEAIAHYQAALALDPRNPALLNDLAWIRAANSQARFRDGAEAVRLAEKACQLTDNKVPIILNTLANAYAESGRFDEAIATEEKVRAVASSLGHNEVADQVLQTIQLFKNHQAFHESAPPVQPLPR